MKTSPHYSGLSGRITTAWGRPRNSTSSAPTAHEIKAAISPLAFYLFEIASMPQPVCGGWVDGGLCPIHGDRTSDVFRINTRTGAFRCTVCGARGNDIIEFIMLRYELGFEQAIESLAIEYGVSHG